MWSRGFESQVILGMPAARKQLNGRNYPGLESFRGQVHTVDCRQYRTLSVASPGAQRIAARFFLGL